MHTVCVSVQSENRSRSLGPKNKIEDEESEREREERARMREREREREAILQLEASRTCPLSSLKHRGCRIYFGTMGSAAKIIVLRTNKDCFVNIS